MRFAVRHERIAQRIAFGAFLCLALNVGLGAALTLLSPMAMPAVFAFFMGTAMLAWGVAMIASWFGPTDRLPHPYGHGLMGFARRASTVYAVAFLLGWFTIGLGLIAMATLTAIALLPQLWS